VKVTLTHLLQSIRVAQADSAFVELGAGSGVRFSGERQAFLHLVLSGTALLDDVDAAAQLALAAGDYAVVLGPRAPALRATAAAKPANSAYFASRHDHDAPPTLRFGRGVATRILTCAFHLQGTHPLLRALPPRIAVTRDTQPLQLDIDGIARAAHGAGATTFLTSLVDTLFVQAVRAALGALFAGGLPAAENLEGFRIPIALSLINSHLEQRWSLARLAAKVNMSRSAFAAEFLASVGEPPMRYLAGRRMARAADLLRWQPIAVADVAWQVGYESVASFARAFKQHFGVTPAVFQRAQAPHYADAVAGHMHWSPFLAAGDRD
jgi:AraC-like DNA-binding protein